jgi:Zn-dependent peptidase ImmA (M78 family)
MNTVVGANWDKAKEAASAVLEKSGARQPFVDVYSIAELEGIQIIPIEPESPYQDVSGFLNSNGDKPVIYVNANNSPQRQAFTIAHELGHYFLGHTPDEWGINRRPAAYTQAKPSSEQEADCFAANLLMPANMVKKQMRAYKLTPENYDILAGLFGVSPSAMKNRLSSREFR